MMISWTVERDGRVYVYSSKDLCACVWVECVADVDLVHWDVSGPEGRGTKASGAVQMHGLATGTRILVAQALASQFIHGYRQAARELWPQHKEGETP